MSASLEELLGLRENVQNLNKEMEDLNLKMDNANKMMDELSRRQYIVLLTRTMAIMRQMGLPAGISQAIGMVQRLTIGVYHLYLNLKMLYAASGPLGWLFAATGLFFSASTIADAVSMGEDIY